MPTVELVMNGSSTPPSLLRLLQNQKTKNNQLMPTIELVMNGSVDAAFTSRSRLSAPAANPLGRQARFDSPIPLPLKKKPKTGAENSEPLQPAGAAGAFRPPQRKTTKSAEEERKWHRRRPQEKGRRDTPSLPLSPVSETEEGLTWSLT